MKMIDIKVILIVLCLLNTVGFAWAQSPKIDIIYIGDSITAGAGLVDSLDCPPAIADNDLRKLGIDVAGSSNQGYSGYTTLDFMPNTTAFKNVEAAADKLKNNEATLVFSIMLGTNDSAIQGPNGSPVTKEQYYENLKIITDQLLKDYPSCTVVIHRQLWYSPNTYNGSKYLQEGLDRLQSYYSQVKRLVSWYSNTENGRVFLGDTKAYRFFSKNYQATLQPESGHEGTFYLHPNKIGAVALAGFWSKAIYKVVNKN